MTVSPIKPYRLGGSVAAAANGVDRFRSPVALFGELTGVPAYQREETEAMKWGKLMEPLILDALAQDYELMPAPADGFVDPDRPWLVGHPDSLAALNGDLSGAEAKTHNRWVLNGGGVPISDDAQVQIYMHLTNTERWIWSCLVDGQRLVTEIRERNQWAIDTLLEGLDEFHKLLERNPTGALDLPWPAPDGSTATRDALMLKWPHAEPGKAMRLSGQEWQWQRELVARHEQLATVKAQVVELENKLKDAMGDAELAISPHDTEAIRWTNVATTRLDQKGLKLDEPEAYTRHLVTTRTRRFSLL